MGTVIEFDASRAKERAALLAERRDMAQISAARLNARALICESIEEARPIPEEIDGVSDLIAGLQRAAETLFALASVVDETLIRSIGAR